MGQNVDKIRFSKLEFQEFERRLQRETTLLRKHIRDRSLSHRGPVAGFELEAWLVDRQGRPSPTNESFLERLGSPLVVPELARFNIEVNGSPTALQGNAFTRLQDELESTWSQCRTTASAMDLDLALIGILPSCRATDLTAANMSRLARYQALNEQVLAQRQGQPLELRINGRERLRYLHEDVMMEAGATSFQIHLQVHPDRAAALFNASLIASPLMVAATANSPYLFNHSIWEETRIPLFEQAVNVGQQGYHRVSFGAGYARDAMLSLFEENLAHYPVLIPALSDDAPGRMQHVRFHNGTIWRWNRPLIGFDHDGQMHLRIEHRVVPAGPTLVDCVANAALYYGLVHHLAAQFEEAPARLPFEVLKADFYQAAQYGLEAEITWLDGLRYGVRQLLLDHLLIGAADALSALDVPLAEIQKYLGIVKSRVAGGTTGAAWQRAWVARHGADMAGLVRAYLHRQAEGEPVHTWDL